jgi:histidine triad (HIT) family protein
MDNCIFCKIIKGDIPSVKIFEDETILAFLDISQSTKGHTLVIPKQHIENIFELDEETATHIFKHVPKLSNAISQAFNANGLNLINNNKEAAGQTVFHYHVHLIPRYDSEDGFRPIFTNNMDHYTKDDLLELAVKIKEKIK